MTVPTVTARVDWWGRGVFTDPLDDVGAWLLSPDRITRGRSTDYGSDAIGQRTFRLSNDTGRFTPDRNWHDNPSFEIDTAGWSILATGLTAAATSIAKVVDNAPSAGSSAGEAVLPATATAGVSYAIPHKFRGGVSYAIEVYLKSTAGATSVVVGIGSNGTPADVALSSGAITTSWAAKTVAWTPSADRDDVVFFVRNSAAAAATVRIDRVQINEGATVGTYLEAPTKGLLAPGRPVHLYATYSAVDYPLFFGRIERISPIPLTREVEVVCYDPLRRYQETDVVVPAHAFVVRSARDFRREILADAERGTRNLVGNPEFATDTAGWAGLGTLTRLTTDGPSVAAAATCGEYVTTATSQRATYALRLAPVFLAGQVYRASFYLRAPGVIVDTEIGVISNVTTHASRTITPTATWTRYTLTWTQPTTVKTSDDTYVPTLFVGTPTTAGTVRIGAVSVTRGQALYPYAAVGTGRWPDWCANGSFEGGGLNGWYDGWSNLCTNPSFETNTTGWVVTADAFHAAATSITRVLTDPKYGAANADIATPATETAGAHFVLSGTFKTKRTYRIYGSVKPSTSASFVVGIGSQGTPADKAQLQLAIIAPNYGDFSFTWAPTADRTDAHLYVYQVSAVALTMHVDGFAVFLRDASATTDPLYADTGPGGGGVPITTEAISTTAKVGSKSQQSDTPATATAGVMYDFNHLGGYFVAGQPYTGSVWLRPTSNMPYKVGLWALKTDGTFDEASATGTATANVWTQVTVTWTPSADRSSFSPFRVGLYVYQTDATARTFLTDAVRVIPGSSADDYEMTHWILAAETDTYQTSASLEGSALAVLGTLNRLTLSRHYVRPTMTSPFYEYVVGSRDDFAGKTVQETILDTGEGGVEDLSPWQLDRAAIVNIVPVTHTLGTNYYSDEASVDRYGPRPTGAIGNSAFLAASIGDIIGPALVARYKDPRARPTLRRTNRFPQMLARQVDDKIAVTAERHKVASHPFLIVTWELEIEQAGLVWRAKYLLEEMP